MQPKRPCGEPHSVGPLKMLRPPAQMFTWHGASPPEPRRLVDGCDTCPGARPGSARRLRAMSPGYPSEQKIIPLGLVERNVGRRPSRQGTERQMRMISYNEHEMILVLISKFSPLMIDYISERKEFYCTWQPQHSTTKTLPNVDDYISK